MSFISQKIIGIDFHDYSAELVELKEHGSKISLESYGRVLIAPNIINKGEIIKEKELKEILLDLIKNANPSSVQSKNVAIVFPPSKVHTHIFSFPADLNERELKKAIPYEAETIIPFSINDIYWDFNIIEKEDKSKKHASQRVLFACVAKETADKYAEILESIGLSPSVFSIHAETIKNAMRGQLERGKTSLIIDIGVLSINYLVLRDEKLTHYFSSNDSGKKLLSEVASELQIRENEIYEKKEKNRLSEAGKIPKIKEFIENAYKKGREIIDEHKKNHKIDAVILTGEFVNLPDFYNIAKTFFPDQEILVGDPKLCLVIDDKKFTPEIKGDKIAIPYSTYFTNAIGAALRGLNKFYDNKINLIPDRLKETFTSKKNTTLLAVSAIVMTIISLLAGTYMFFKFQNLNFKRLNLEIQKTSIINMIYGTRYREIKDEIIRFNNEISVLSKIDDKLFSVPETIKKIENLLPQGIKTTALSFNDTELTLTINGIATTRDALLKTQRNFEEAEFIKEVVSPLSNYDEKTQISFTLQIKLDFIKLEKYGASSNGK